MTRNQLIKTAREYLGTPFHHQARLKGVGIDCIGLVVCTLRECGYNCPDNSEYGRQPNGMLLLRLMQQHGAPVLLENARPGDVAIFRFHTSLPCHVAFLSDKGMIHAYSLAQQVVEHRVDETWRQRMVAAFAVPGVED